MDWKKRMGALLLTLALAMTLAVPALAAEPVAETPANPFETALEYGGAAMGSYAVWQDGAIIDQGTGGPILEMLEPQASLAMAERNVYGIGSVSKMYVTTAVMKLAQAGRINLDAPVTRYLRDFKMADGRYTAITVRMLLNHTSGLMGTTGPNKFLFADDDQQATEQLLARLSTQQLKSAPGEIAAYCNDGFTLAELVVEAVSGQDFMDYVRATILNPLRLRDTYAPQDAFSPDRVAPTYSGGNTDRELPVDFLSIVGAGGMYATAADVAAFGGALTGINILTETSTSAMSGPEYERGIWPDEPLGMVSFGLGWDAVEFWPFAQNGIQCLVKGGDTLRHHAALLVLPEYNMAAAVLSSGGISTYNEMAAAQILVEALEAQGVEIDQTVPALAEATPAEMPAALVAESGYYGAFSQQVEATVTEDGKLVIRQVNLAGIPDQTLTYYSDGSFRDETNSVAVKLVKERNGYTYFYQQGYSSLPGLGMAASSDYMLVKMPENKVSADLQAHWDVLNSLSALPLEEKYTSQMYLILSESAGTSNTTLASVPGYVMGCRIVDENTARYELPIGRDASDILVLPDGRVSMTGTLYQTEPPKDLYTGSGYAYVTIPEDGTARWLGVGQAAGRTMSVKLPENAGFYVYDGDGALVGSSYLWGDLAVELPEDGLVVFAGDADARFHLQFSQS